LLLGALLLDALLLGALLLRALLLSALLRGALRCPSLLFRILGRLPFVFHLSSILGLYLFLLPQVRFLGFAQQAQLFLFAP
jgi:hypothetical protein